MPQPRHTPTLTPTTAEFLLALVNNLTLSVGAEDFDQALDQVVRARGELRAVIDSQS